MAGDEGAAGASVTAEVRTYTQAEVEALIRAMSARERMPAIEEGPHLLEPENRALKREQMVEAGWTVATPVLTEDMRAILAEGE